MLLPQNVNNLIAQNAYVFVLATGMLFCILTGGNIDLSVGSVVCFIGAIGACFIGGASAYGGISTVPGVIIGATLMGVLNLGMSIMGVNQNIQKVVKGLVLMAAVIFDVVSKRKLFIVKQ